MKTNQRRIDIGPHSIYYQEIGEGDPLVLVHGLSASSRWWSRNIDVLARHFHVYAIDLIGFGASRGKERFVLREAAGLLAKWMDRAGIERAHLVGHSMGGFIAVQLTSHYPQQVDRLVLVDAAIFPEGYRQRRAWLGLIGSIRYMPIRFLPLLVTDALRSGPRTLWSAGRDLLTTDIRPDLAGVESSALVVWGEHDALVPVEIGQSVVERLREAEWRVIPGAGHNPMWDRPGRFNQAVLEFLGAHPHAPRSGAGTSVAPHQLDRSP